MDRRFAFAGLAVLIVAVVGVLVGQPWRVPTPGTGPTPAPAPATPAPTPPPVAKFEEEAKEALKVPEAAFKIAEPGTNDWQPTPQPSPERDLAAKMDDAMRRLSGAMIQTYTIYELPGATGGVLRGNGTILIDDARNFRIEYYSPTNPTTLLTLVADGTRRGELLGPAGWRSLPAFGAPASPQLTDQQLRDWPDRFERSLFSYFAEGRDAWGPLLGAWAEGRGGYRLTVETKVRGEDLGGTEAIRILASTEQDIPTRIEIIVDGEHYRPVTVRILRGPAGAQTKIVWTGAWFFGGEIDRSAFKVPENI